MNFVGWGFAGAEPEGAFLFQATLGGALDEARSHAVSDAAKSTDAARQHQHGIGGIRTAGYVSADIGVRLHLNLADGTSDRSTKNLTNEIGAAFQAQFLGEHEEGAIGGDEVDGSDAFVAHGSEEKLAQKDRSAGAGGRYGQNLRRMIEQK